MTRIRIGPARRIGADDTGHRRTMRTRRDAGCAVPGRSAVAAPGRSGLQVRLDPFREAPADAGHRRDLLDRRLRTRLAEPKTRSSARLRAGPTPGRSSNTDFVVRLRAQLAVVGDREPVRLVAQPLDQVQRLRGRPAARSGRCGRAGTAPRAPWRGPTSGMSCSPSSSMTSSRGADLALAAVDDDEVGHPPAQLLRAPLLAASERAKRRRSTSWWLAKSSVPSTVRTRKRRYSPLRGRPSSNTTIVPTVLVPWMLRDVVALDPQRRRRQAERVGQLLRARRSVLPSSASQRACSRARASPPRCGRRGPSAPALASLRHVGRDARCRGAARGTRSARPSSGRRCGSSTAAGWTRRARVVLLHEGRQRFLVGPVAEVLEQEHVAAERLAVADREQLDRGLVALAREPSTSSSARAKAAIFWLPSSARWRGPCPAARPPARTRACPRRPASPGAAPARPAPGGPRGRASPGRCPRGSRPSRWPRCRALAALDVVQEAGSRQRALAFLDLDRAGPEREEPADEVHRLVDRRSPTRTGRSSGCRPGAACASARCAGSRRPA